jgi:hypothetical protein
MFGYLEDFSNSLIQVTPHIRPCHLQFCPIVSLMSSKKKFRRGKDIFFELYFVDAIYMFD